MKKSQGVDKEVKKLKLHLSQIQENLKKSSIHLWLNDEVIIRKKMKVIKQLPQVEESVKESLYYDYTVLLDEVSTRILTHYNDENQTDYTLEEIKSSYPEAYLNSGVLCVLLSIYLPHLLDGNLKYKLAGTPKDEYKQARKMKRHFYLHLGETNTGKTYQAIQCLKKARRGIYLAPLRLLALENYETLNQDHVKCHLLTGEEEILVEGATHISCTIEKLDLNQPYDCAIIDEIQLIQDKVRGSSWTRAILGLMCQEIHLCGATNAKQLLIQLIEECNDEYEVINYQRQTPLCLEQTPFQLNLPQKGDAIIVFSKKKVLELSRYYQDRGYQTSVIYGDLPPEVRRLQYTTFINGESDLLISTDAIGMGVNLPIRRIVFMNHKKFDGEDIRELTSQEVKQIAGRAGRKGMYDIGYVSTLAEYYNFIKEKLECEDQVIEQAIIGPNETLLEINGIPLIEKLAIWATRYSNLTCYEKMDIQNYLYVLTQIKRYKLDQWIQWKIMKLPLNFMNAEILNLLIFYIEEHFVDGNWELTKPRLHTDDLDMLEIHYQEVSLYYSFSKAFHLTYDAAWIYRERAKISKKLNYLLHRL